VLLHEFVIVGCFLAASLTTFKMAVVDCVNLRVDITAAVTDCDHLGFKLLHTAVDAEHVGVPLHLHFLCKLNTQMLENLVAFLCDAVHQLVHS